MIVVSAARGSHRSRRPPPTSQGANSSRRVSSASFDPSLNTLDRFSLVISSQRFGTFCLSRGSAHGDTVAAFFKLRGARQLDRERIFGGDPIAPTFRSANNNYKGEALIYLLVRMDSADGEFHAGSKG